MSNCKGNKILLLVENINDFKPIARAFNGIKNTANKVDLNNPQHSYFPETKRFWVFVVVATLGYKAKYDTYITLAVAGENYDTAYHGWLELMGHLED